MKTSVQNFNNYPISKVKIAKKSLFCRGNFKKSLLKKSIAIVGSRHMTRYGGYVVDKFVSEFVAHGITTISGFMYGVDTEVHTRTVGYNGKTIAVFGCGLDVVYPPENDKLYNQILENGGVVLSEYEPSAKAHLWKFPQRNKIVASLAALGVLVIEAGEGSGSLITANIAHKIGKKVYAIPGPINSSVSKGTNSLIKESIAKIVTSPEDIIGASSPKSKTTISNLSSQEEKILQVLSREPLNIDELSAQTGESIIEISKTLSLMSIKGLIVESSGKYYVPRI